MSSETCTEDDAYLELYDKINQQLKDFAQVSKTYPNVVEDYKTYYQNKITESHHNLNNTNRQIEEVFKNESDERINSNVKFQRLMKVIYATRKELSERSYNGKNSNRE